MEKLVSNIKKAHLGDEPACKELYEQFMPYCYGICLRYGVAKHDVKDILQITFSSIFTSLKSFDIEKASFKTWISRITVNKILDYRKSQSQTKSTVSIEDAYTLSSKGNEINSVDKDYVFNILARIPKKYQAVFNLFIIDGFSHKEIAEKLDISELASRSNLMRGREWAKKALSDHLITPEKYGF